MLQADQRLIERIDKNDATGEVETLVGHLTGTRMGDRAMRSKPVEAEKLKEKKAKADLAKQERTIKRGGDSVLTDRAEGSFYRPKTQDTQRVYEMILTYITDIIGSQPRDVVSSAADDILAIMKNERIQVVEYPLARSADIPQTKAKQKEIEGVIGAKLNDERFKEIVQLASKISDYVKQTDAPADANTLDDQTGVAVILDSEGSGEVCAHNSAPHWLTSTNTGG